MRTHVPGPDVQQVSAIAHASATESQPTCPGLRCPHQRRAFHHSRFLPSYPGCNFHPAGCEGDCGAICADPIDLCFGWAVVGACRLGWEAPRPFAASDLQVATAFGQEKVLLMSDEEEQDSPEELAVMRGVASRIRAARLNAKLSQVDLAEKTGLKRAFVYGLERGDSNMTLKTLTKVARALGMSPTDLMPQSETPRLAHRDVETFVGLLDQLSAQIRADHEEALKRSLSVLFELKSLVERMRPLTDEAGTEPGSQGHTTH